MSLSTPLSHPVFDDEAAIIQARNQRSPVDLVPWQERIDHVVGRTPTNKPKLRVVWGQDLLHARHIIFGEWRATYPYYRYEEGGKIHDVGTPRFYVEELHDVAELGAGDNWERARYLRDPQTGIAQADVLGPLPQDGYYTTVFMIAEHGTQCCGGRESIKGEPCLGRFRLPTDADIERIRRMHQRREQAMPAEVAPTPEDIAAKTKQFIATRDQQSSSRIAEAVKDFMDVHGWRFTTLDPTALHHGRFHWLSGHNRSGAPTTPRSIA